MPQVRLLAPWTDSKGDPQASGAVINVSDEEARDLNNRGVASLLDEEQKLEEQELTSAVYDARLQRESAPGAAPTEAPKPAEEPPPP
jgi:hypothetical protein